MALLDSAAKKIADAAKEIFGQDLPEDMKQAAALLQAVIDHAISGLAGKRVVISIEDKQ